MGGGGGGGIEVVWYSTCFIMLAIHLGMGHFGCFAQMVACGSKSHLLFRVQ